MDALHESPAKKSAGPKRAATQAQSLSSEPNFNASTVKCLGDVPAAWMVALFQKASEHPVLEATVELLCGKSLQPIRNVTLYLSGPSRGQGGRRAAREDEGRRGRRRRWRRRRERSARLAGVATGGTWA